MSEDRLRKDQDEVKNLDDIIEARDESTSHIARDVDADGVDIIIPEDIDVDDALTFPHYKKKHEPVEDVELMDTPRDDDIDINWAESQEDMLPSDYMEDYNDALTTDIEDTDNHAEDEIDEMGDLTEDDLIYGSPLVNPLPKGFHPEVEPEDENQPLVGRKGGDWLDLETAMDTRSEEGETTIEDKFGGEIDPDKARDLLRGMKKDIDEEQSD